MLDCFDEKSDYELPLVSIIVPVYNVENYLRQCLDSLLGQTLDRIEIICVDDCSPDNSSQILEEYKAKDNRVKIISLPENRRQGGARNAGILAACSEYIGFVDADDWVDVTMYERLYHEAIRTGADIVSSDYYEFRSGNKVHKCVTKPDYFVDDSGERVSIRGLGPIVVKLYKRDLFLLNNLFFPEKVAYEDNAVNLPLVVAAQKIAKVEYAFYYYRMTNASTTRSRNNISWFDRVPTSNLLLDNLRKWNLYPRYKAYFDRVYLQTIYLWSGIGCFSKFSKPQVDFIRCIKQNVEAKLPDYRNCTMFWQGLSFKYRLSLFLIYRMGKLGIYSYWFCHKVKRKIEGARKLMK